MRAISRRSFLNRKSVSPWQDAAPVREELFGIERLEQHAETLALAQQVARKPPRVASLQARLDDNAQVLLAAYRSSAAELERGGDVVPAAEWLLDNYHLVDDQIREIRADLPPGYYRQLPKLANGPFAGYPRVFGLAWAFVAHTDSHFDPDVLRRFVTAYQRVEALMIGELWAVAITLRIVLVENLRRLADQIARGRVVRAEADLLADALLAADGNGAAPDLDRLVRSSQPLSERYAAQLAQRLRGQDPQTMPALEWLERRLQRQGSSIADAVQSAQQRQGASNLTIRNIITSMRLISDIDWAELVESVSVVDHRLRAGSNFAAMDFKTRDLYRKAIEEMARGSARSELAVTDAVLAAARQAAAHAKDQTEAERLADPGYHLLDDGRLDLESTIGFRPSMLLRVRRFNKRLGLAGYVGGILLIGMLLLCLSAIALWSVGVSCAGIAVFTLAGAIPASELAVALINRAAIGDAGAVALPGLELKSGVPSSLRTLVAVPTLLTSEADILAQVEALEVHHLSGNGGDLHFALLSDGIDAKEAVLTGDAHLLSVAATAIAKLNARHPPGPGGARFHLLHRRRAVNASERAWMGWERKRGKLHELNRLLRGAQDTTFMPVEGRAPRPPEGVRYVVTLDSDTRLLRDTVVRLVGKMAHPLNRPRFDAGNQRIVGGYGILQPRVTPSLPTGNNGSLYQEIVAGSGGIDPYATATSDVYQDLFGEGSYTGKGIYDVDAFEAALAGRMPDNTILSHDLLEGIYARSGLVSDIEVVDDFPSRYDVVARRQHRWTRGDWQLLPWILGTREGVAAMPALGRWKMIDNLRRSLVVPATLLLLGVSWLLPAEAVSVGLLLSLAAIAMPAFLPVAASLLPKAPGVRWRSHLRGLMGDAKLIALRISMSLVLLPDEAWRMGDAILRTLVRLFVTHHHLLEWTTAATLVGSPRMRLSGFYRSMSGGLALGGVLALGALLLSPAAWPYILPFAILWVAAPALALWVSRPRELSRRLVLSPPEIQALRLVARRTWRYFEVFVTPADNMLPPDNFQEDPKPVLARRTSPTNIGLYLLSVVAARDFGWAGTMESVERLEATMATVRKLARLNGHLFNWYDTRDLRALEPAYVSSVDSGNLAGHLIVLANACEDWINAAAASSAQAGMIDAVLLARAAVDARTAGRDEKESCLPAILGEIEEQLRGAASAATFYPALRNLGERAVEAAHMLAPTDGNESVQETILWVEVLQHTIQEHDRDRSQSEVDPHALNSRLHSIATEARTMALAMDFAFLLDPERKLLSIGYSVADNRHDTSCYDLLASEARLASLFAIAKGDVATEHWFRLGRAATPLRNGAALISWSGSMFEYLMPSLVMRAPAGSLLERTNSLVVERQRSYAESLDIPWGVSESAYNARDMEFTYQYSNFGVPGLGLKRGLAQNRVIAPYATGLAAMVDPRNALRNYRRLEGMGGSGRYGFYEALDFTRSRLPDNTRFAMVRCFMAHHQGMTIVALGNVINDANMRARFHSEPIIKASELLLQERLPRGVAVAHPRAEEVQASASVKRDDTASIRRLVANSHGPPVTHLLSNGRYAVMLTTAGSGYSRWCDIAVTRWHEDSTRDDWGSFIFLRDVVSGESWSAAARPAAGSVEKAEVVFAENSAEFHCRDETLATLMDVVVSSEDDGEVRRVSITNSGRRSREVDVTSYAELALAAPAADNAHPVFSKLFIQTEFLPEFGALIATRRRRSPGDPEIWAAHFAVVEGDVSPPQYETDRARFIGRGRDLSNAIARTEGAPLGNTSGTVLDPIFSLRHRLVIPAGAMARISFWTLVAPSRGKLLDLVDQHHDRNAYDRARTLAWTQAQVQLRHLNIEDDEAADFQRLAAPILYADARFRAPVDAILRGAGPQQGLWPLGISGDLPIVLLRIDDIEDIAQVQQLLRAHEYWRMKGLSVDLVIINERASSYTQDLQVAIDTAVRSSQVRPRFGAPALGSVYALRADLLSGDARALLQSVARVALIARRGPIGVQLARLPVSAMPPVLKATREQTMKADSAAPPLTHSDLEFFNGLGGFDRDGREYVTILGAGQTTPAPWVNVIANPAFGFQVSAEGSGYTWAVNSRENQITVWSNDPVRDPACEAVYIRDEETGEIWTPTAQPIRDNGIYVARHGFGYSRFSHEVGGMALDLLQYVPPDDPIKISRLTIRNLSGRLRRLSVTAFAELVLGTSRGAAAPSIITEIDAATDAIFARNPWAVSFAGQVAFADLGGRQTAWTADRAEFLGRRGGMSRPTGLRLGHSLSGAAGAGLDPCAALQDIVTLGPGEQTEIVWFLGQAGSAADARALIRHYRAANLDAIFDAVVDGWRARLAAVQVRTPDRAMDIMLNGWLLYQTLACRIWARSAFYQASGAYGFRDQLQDGMALGFAFPDETRRHILRAASRQFADGDVQHWWLPHSGQGVRTGISDDHVWLAFATATYVKSSGDTGLLDEVVPFVEGPRLADGDHDAFFQPMIGDETATVFEHCARGIDRCLDRTGTLGLPLIGTGDWNDGMNRVGQEGRGESVWLAWLLLRSIALLEPFARDRDPDRMARWRKQAETMRAAVEHEAWDGDWYRRATFDDGTWIGSRDSQECSIDSIAQSWAVLSGMADPGRAATAMASLKQYLIREEDGLALLFTPPFDNTPLDPGYIKGYPPGLRENGGQYSHAAMWAIMAFAELGDGKAAADLFAMLNPIHHADTPEAVARYNVEPYAVAADIYSVAPHVGRGGWTWYTGAAGWMYRAGIEGILGLRREGDSLIVRPSIPDGWPGFEATVMIGSGRYDIRVTRAQSDGADSLTAKADEGCIEQTEGVFQVPLDGKSRTVRISI